MTRLNFTFQEASPLISYSPQWVEGTDRDPEYIDYDGSFRVTFTAGSTASFTFTGSAVSLFGATRRNHGNYTVNLDNQPPFSGVGFTPQDLFNQSLWHANDLPYTQHTVTLTNVPTDNNDIWLDLDFISIERQIGQDGDTIFQTAFDDASPAVRYVGPWDQTSNTTTAYQETLHTTNAANSQVAVTFRGCCVEIYGQYTNAPYTVAVDNLAPVNMSGMDVDLTPDQFHPQTLLYLIDGLSENDTHTVTLTNTESNVKRPFSFDYAVVSSIQNITADGTPPPTVGVYESNVQSTSAIPSATNVPVSVSNASSTNVGTPVAVIAGASISALLFVLALLVLAYIVVRRRGWKDARREAKDFVDQAEPKRFQVDLESQLGIPARVLRPISARLSNSQPRMTSRPGSEVIPHWHYSHLAGEDSSQRGQSSPSGVTNAATNVTQSSYRDRKGAVPPRSDLPPPVQEHDAGTMIEPESEHVPPAYNVEWRPGGR